MQLDKRLEFLVSLALVAFDPFEEDEEAELAKNIMVELELKEESIPDVDNISALLLLQAGVKEIQAIIDNHKE